MKIISNIVRIKKQVTAVVVTLVVAQLYVFVLPVMAIDTGYHAPTNVVSNTGWVLPAAAYNSDNIFAIADSGSDVVQYGSFNFNVPTGATIDGIEVSVEGFTFGVGSRQANLSLTWNGGASWTSNKTTNMPRLISSEATRLYGQSNDLWGRPSWVSEDFSNSNFRLKIDARDATLSTLNIDSVAAKVYYTLDTTAPYTSRNVIGGSTQYDDWYFGSDAPVINLTTETGATIFWR